MGWGIITFSSLSLSPPSLSLLSPPPSHSSSLGKPPKPSRSSIEDTATAANQGAEAELEVGEEEEVFHPPSSPPSVS